MIDLLERLRPGDHLRVRRLIGYAHDAIYIGDGLVIHFSGGTKYDCSIRSGTLADFLQSTSPDRVELLEYGFSLDAPEVVGRAWSMLGRRRYNAVFNNCQHFARWCKTGDPHSDDVRAVTMLAGGAGLARCLAQLSIATALATAASGTAGGAAFMSGLAGMTGSALGGVALTTATPAFGMWLATQHLLRDDPYLTAEERAARRRGRHAATVAAPAGTLAALYWLSQAGFPGVSAVGISSGLRVIGTTMLRGLGVLGAVPTVLTLGVGLYVYFRQRQEFAAAANAASPL